jgi:hypothetical protein
LQTVRNFLINYYYFAETRTVAREKTGPTECDGKEPDSLKINGKSNYFIHLLQNFCKHYPIFYK